MHPDSGCIDNFRHNENYTLHPGDDVCDRRWHHIQAMMCAADGGATSWSLDDSVIVNASQQLVLVAGGCRRQLNIIVRNVFVRLTSYISELKVLCVHFIRFGGRHACCDYVLMYVVLMVNAGIIAGMYVNS